MANLRSKNDRAVAAYITPIAQAVDPSVSIYPANYSLERAFPIIDVSTSQGAESPPFSGNHSLNVRVRIEYPAANQPGQSNPQSNRLALDSMVDAVFDAFHKSDNGCMHGGTARRSQAIGLLDRGRSHGTEGRTCGRCIFSVHAASSARLW